MSSHDKRPTRRSKQLTRREFVTSAAQAALGVGILAWAGGRAGAEEIVKPKLVYQKLGRTGFEVTRVSIGAMNLTDPAVVARAVDLGVNYVDTARSYTRGQNEALVAEGIGGRRDKVRIATKIGQNTRENMLASLETSLSQLKTDHVDVLMVHNLTTRDGVLNPTSIEVMSEAKKSGKALAVGISTHSNQAECVRAAMDSKLYDVVLVGFNSQSPPEVAEALKEAHGAGLGIVAMKTQQGGRRREALPPDFHKSALKWVLQHDFVDCAIPGVRTIKEVDEDVAVMGEQLTAKEAAALKRHMMLVKADMCVMCGACLGTCPKGLDVPNVNRCLMYHEDYGDPMLARAEYAGLRASPRLTACASCTTCAARCPRGVNIADRMARARAVFA